METDNKGAYDLCHRFTSAQHSRHIDRKLFKMREMRGAGDVVVKYVPTDENTSDIMTKVLSTQPFKKHRKTLLNGGDEPALFFTDNGAARTMVKNAKDMMP